MQPRIVAGAHLKCYVNGELMGNVTGLGFVVRTGHERRGGLDTAEAVELVPTTFSLTGTISLVRNRHGPGLESSVTAPFKDNDGHTLPRMKYITIELLDRVSGKIVFRANKAVVNDQNWTVGAKQLMTGTFSFEAIGFSNEYNPLDVTD